MKADAEDLLFDNVSELCSSAVRGCIVAPEGCKLVVADLSNIEGRVAAWLAGEEWKLQAFRDFDKGIGADLYKLAYGRSFLKKPEDVTKDERQIGKVMELSLQYQGGPGAFAKMGAAYGVNLPEETVGMLVKAWRKAHRAISSMWYDLENAARGAIRAPDEMFEVRGLRFSMKDGWLRLRLPSGRYLSYCGARINEEGSLCYQGINQYTRKWEEIDTYGGKFLEQATQATARDIFMGGLKRADEAGYNVVLRVHDELVCETPDDARYSVDGLAGCMVAGESWALGLPLAAAGHEMARYAKLD
jgi:DNA polymerase